MRCLGFYIICSFIVSPEFAQTPDSLIAEGRAGLVAEADVLPQPRSQAAVAADPNREDGWFFPASAFFPEIVHQYYVIGEKPEPEEPGSGLSPESLVGRVIEFYSSYGDFEGSRWRIVQSQQKRGFFRPSLTLKFAFDGAGIWDSYHW